MDCKYIKDKDKDFNTDENVKIILKTSRQPSVLIFL